MSITREELINSPEYWLQHLQLDLCQMVENYIERHDLNRSEFAKQLGKSRSYVSQLLSGDFDSKLSTLVELSLACGFVPALKFTPKEEAERAFLSAYYKAEGGMYSKKSTYTMTVKQPSIRTNAGEWDTFNNNSNKAA